MPLILLAQVGGASGPANPVDPSGPSETVSPPAACCTVGDLELATEVYTNTNNWADCSVVTVAALFSFPVDAPPGTAEVCYTWDDVPNETSLLLYDMGDFDNLIEQGTQTTICKTVSYPATFDEDGQPLGTEVLSLYLTSDDEGRVAAIDKSFTATLSQGGTSCVCGENIVFRQRFVSQNIQNPQGEDVTYYLGNGTNLSTLIANADANSLVTEFQSASLSGQREANVIFRGTLNVDIDYTFGSGASSAENGMTLIGRLSEINVLPGNTLTIQNTGVAGCQNLWSAINVDNGGTLRIINSSINDSEAGISVKDGGTLIAEDVEFRNNYVGISTPVDANSPTLGRQDVEATVFGSEFNFKVPRGIGNEGDFFVPKPILLSPFIGETPRAGAEINNVRTGGVVFADGGLGSQENLFARLANGIIFNYSSGVVSGSRFRDLPEVVGQANSGNGILVTGTNVFSRGSVVTLFDEGQPFGGRVEFDGMTTAVRVNAATTVRVTGALMQNIENGVFASESGTIRFYENDVRASQYGFLRLLPNFVGRSYVSGNTFTTGSLSGGVTDPSAIKLAGNPRHRSSYHLIDDNTLEFDGALFGVQSIALNGLRVRDNVLNWQPGKMFGTRGIDVRGGRTPQVYQNLIEGNLNDDFTETVGVHLEMTDRPDVYCNTFSDVETHLSFLHDNGGAEIQGNLFLDGGVGLQYGDPAISNDATVTGAQNHNANTWSGSYTGFAAAWYNSTPSLRRISEFIVDNGDAPGFLPGSFNLGVNDWFLNELNSPTQNYVCATAPPTPTGGLTPSDTAVSVVINGLYQPSGSWEATEWLATTKAVRRYEEGLLDPNDYPNWTAWWNEPETQTSEAFVTVEALLANEADLTESEVDLLVAYGEQVDNHQLALAQLNVEKYRDGNDNTQTSAAIVSKADSLYQAAQGLLQLVVGKVNTVATRRAQAASLNHQLPANETPRLYQRYMNTFELAVANEGLSSNDLDPVLITSIAEDCPLHGGEAVYQARALAAALALPVVIDDATACQSLPPAPRNRMNAEPALTASANVYPNPTNGFFRFDLNGETADLVRVTDLSGRTVAVRQLPEAVSFGRVPIADVAPGAYTVTFFASDERIHARLLIVK